MRLRPGFTLLEATVVLAIAGILLARSRLRERWSNV